MANNTTAYKFRDAIRHALANYENVKGSGGKIVKRGEALRHIANSILHVAINGSFSERIVAAKELADRLDGKAVQAIVGPEGEPITVVQRVIVQHLGEKEIDITPRDDDEVKVIGSDTKH